MTSKTDLTIQVGIHEAKTNLSKLIEKALLGYSVVIAKGNTPVVTLEPFSKRLSNRIPGRDEGKIIIADNFKDIPEGFEDFYK